MDYRQMFSSEYIAAWDLEGKDVTLKIADVKIGKLKDQKTQKEGTKPVVMFVGFDKGLVINKTNGRTIEKMYGTDTENWKGKRITLYAAQVEVASETKDCIRIRPDIPTAKVSDAKA